MKLLPGFNTVTPCRLVRDAEASVACPVKGLGGVRGAHGNIGWISQPFGDRLYEP